MSGIRIDDLQATGQPSEQARLPVMHNGQTNYYTVQQVLAFLRDGVGEDLDNLAKLAAAIGNDENFATTVTNALAGKLAKSENLEDLPNKATARANLGVTLWTPGTISINTLDDGTLPITPAMGRYITLEGHGSADFVIEGFGDACPVGWVFTLVIPRTIGLTGGTAYALGNKVSFIHTASGAGLDLAMNARMFDGSAIFTYEAFPDACDSEGDAAALHEELTFQHLGDGRWILRKLPNEVAGKNVKGWWVRRANGWQTISLLDREDRSTSGLLGTLVNLPLAFTVSTLPPDNAAEYNAFFSPTAYSSTDATGYVGMSSNSLQYEDGKIAMAVMIRSNSNNTIVSVVGNGWWK